MELENIKRWQWALIGLAIGAIVGASRLFYGPDFDKNFVKPKPFRYALMATAANPVPVQGGVYDTPFYLENLVVHAPALDEAKRVEAIEGIVGEDPATEKAPRTKAATAPKSDSDDATAPPPTLTSTDPPKMVNWVTGTIWHHEPDLDPKTKAAIRDPKTGNYKYHWVPAPFYSGTMIPFRVEAQYNFVALGKPNYFALPKPHTTGKVEPRTTYPSIIEYLQDVNKKNGAGTIKFRFAWWEAPKFVMTIYPAAGLVAIGGIWPTVLGLLVGAGFGGKHAKDDYDLSRFKGETKAANPKKATEMTAKDHADLAALEAELEASLKAGAGNRVATEAVAVTEAPVRQLVADAGEAKKAEEKPKPIKTFGADGGDFYPTEIHHEKK